jgi:hypothetical protein
MSPFCDRERGAQRADGLPGPAGLFHAPAGDSYPSSLRTNSRLGVQDLEALSPAGDGQPLP